ncbi:MAG: class I SAM-dependent methyltransferase [Spirochaetales bacterium]|nr:class I SAM-dependent methyltransferase [Spirochaetales bacterium]
MPRTTVPWLYNEFSHSGVNQADPDYPAYYEANMRRFRDFEKVAAEVAAALELTKDDLVVDLGAGTGAFAIPGARHCRKIIAVDTSRPMLDFAAEKARAAGVTNVEFAHAGFLTYEHAGENADAAVSIMALHHLPDFWKTVALSNVHAFLKPGGRFLLTDVVFSFPPDEYEKHLEDEATQIRRLTDNAFADEAYVHYRDEFSTYDWILEGMLDRAGFTIEKKTIHSPTRITYMAKNK